MPGVKFPDNYWQLMVLHGVMECASVYALGGMAAL